MSNLDKGEIEAQEFSETQLIVENHISSDMNSEDKPETIEEYRPNFDDEDITLSIDAKGELQTEDMIVERIRASMKGNREDIQNEITLEQRQRIHSDSFHVIDEDDEGMEFREIEKTDSKDEKMIVIDQKDSNSSQEEEKAEEQNQQENGQISKERQVRMSVIIDPQEDEESDHAEEFENLERRGATKQNEQPIECPSPATLGKNIDNLIVKNKQDEDSKIKLQQFEEIAERTRRMSSIEGDQLLNMFNINQNGFVKRKEMTLSIRQDIFGLNPTIERDGNPAFEVLHGEKSVQHYEKNIVCEHNFHEQHLKYTKSVHQKSFQKAFKSMPCQLQVTNYRLVLIPNLDLKLSQLMVKQPNFVREYFLIQLGQINRIEKMINHQVTEKGSKFSTIQNYIEIHTKDNRYFKFLFSQNDSEMCSEYYHIIDSLCYVDPSEKRFKDQFLYQFKIDINDSNWARYQDGWSLFKDIRAESKRMGVTFDQNCQFKLYDNSKFDTCATYPQWIIVPRSMSTEQVVKCSKFRTKNRLPALTYFHKKSGVSMWRSSQCMNGLMNHRMVEDEMMLTEIGKASKEKIQYGRVVIYDARPKLNAQAQKYIKNGGFEDLKYYRNCDILFCDIDNIHEVSKCFRKIYEISDDPLNFNSMYTYQPLIEASGYLVMISKILKSVNQVVETMMNRKLNVLIHCSDGWDRTAQMCALAQQCIDPYFRTIEGFLTLMSKDWISFGHQFHLRFGQFDKNYKEEQRSPVFIQYLDCVRHLMLQYPLHFEFNQQLIQFIAEEAYNHKYGTFIGNCERQKVQMQLYEKTESMWTYVLTEKERFKNKFYSPENSTGLIKQVCYTSAFPLPEWREYFFKWSEYGYCQANQNQSQSQMENNTQQANNMAHQRYMKEELQQLLTQQFEVLKRLEKQTEMNKKIIIKQPSAESKPKEEVKEEEPKVEVNQLQVPEKQVKKSYDENENSKSKEGAETTEENLSFVIEQDGTASASPGDDNVLKEKIKQIAEASTNGTEIEEKGEPKVEVTE